MGKSPLEIVGEDYEYVVMELSSFQLYYLNNLNLYKAIVLNIFEDHLDWHSDFDDYSNAKLKILKFMNKNENISLNELGTIYPEKKTKELLFKSAGILDIVSKLTLHEDTVYSFIKTS